MKTKNFCTFLLSFAVTLAIFLGTSPRASAQQIDPSLYSSLRWRLLGPGRGGRVSAVAGIPGDPTTYYMGTPGGGVWKTTDAGEVWKPIFDGAHVASIGAVAIARSNPSIIYVGTGEQTDGNGMWKSTNAGATWTHIGLEDTKYITAVIVDPRNPDIVVVAAFGHPILGTGPAGPAKGIYRTTDGGKTWSKTLYKDDMTGVQDLAVDPENARILFAAMWKPYDWRSGEPPSKEQDAWIYKSVDEGETWKPVGTKGLPTEAWGRTGVAVAPEKNHAQRVFAIMTEGLFRSDDSGATWQKITTDPRVVGNFYFSRVFVDPGDIDTVYVMQTSSYRSTDGGKTFEAFKGAPGGDDYHTLWIDPQNSRRMILGVDQGCIISVDGGATWTSWFNQPTGQFYHVITDNQFPYISYAPQQDSGTVAVPNRSDYGELTYRDWFSIGGFEYCTIAPDPLHPNIVYSGGWYGSVVRFDKNTNQITQVFVRSSKFHTYGMAPLVYSPQDPRTLYYGTQYLMKTVNGGESWQILSPDLTVRGDTGKSSAGPSAGHTPFDTDEDEDKDFMQSSRRQPALTVLAPSTIREGLIWAGTMNGIIQVTHDGGYTWQNVSPPGLTEKAEVESIDASHFDVNTAFAAVITPHDDHPDLFRTRDGGKSWDKIVTGLPGDWITWVVREDPVRKNLLYAGTGEGAYVSFDDGDHWQSLQLNLPAATIRDLTVHGDDIVIATYGRGLWVLDDITPLREADPQTAAAAAALLRPQTAMRVRWDNDQETPLPPEFYSTPNPLDGAVFDYYLKSAPASDISLDILDSNGGLIRHYSSASRNEKYLPANVPDYWFGIQETLTKDAGMNRFAWDLRYPPPPTLPYSYWGNALDFVEYTLSDHAIPGQTPREQTLGAIVAPGQYQAVLTVNGAKYTQKFSVVIDPRVTASQNDLEVQFDAARSISAGLAASTSQFKAAETLKDAIADRKKKLEGNSAAKEALDALKGVSDKLDTIQQGTDDAPGLGPVNRDLARIIFMVEAGDAAPSDTAKDATAESCAALAKSLSAWRDLNATTLPSTNSVLAKFQADPLPIAAPASIPASGCAAP